MDDQHEARSERSAGPERQHVDDPHMDDPGVGDPDVGDPDVGGGTDTLLAVRAALDDVDQLPLEERADVFERAHQVVVDELRALELG